MEFLRMFIDMIKWLFENNLPAFILVCLIAVGIIVIAILQFRIVCLVDKHDLLEVQDQGE